MAYEWLPGVLAYLERIEAYEVIQVLSSERRWPRGARSGDGELPVPTIWGRTLAGRPLIVALQEPSARTFITRMVGAEMTGHVRATLWVDANSLIIIGAREMRPDQVMELFENWEAGRE